MLPAICCQICCQAYNLIVLELAKEAVYGCFSSFLGVVEVYFIWK
jgi:hypothetical protein